MKHENKTTEQKMENSKRKRSLSNRGVEENTMAILESFCSYDSSHIHDDRLAFLEAVRSSAIVSENRSPPTNKMMKAIFGIMRDEKSLEVIIASYRLLCELEKHYPRAYLSNGDSELVVFEEAWSPFAVGSDGSSSCRNAAEKGSKEPINAADFHLLLARLIEGFDEMESSETKLELLAEMMLFIYLITILEADFLPRNQAFLANSRWIPLRESFLNKLLVSRTMNYKGLVKDCLNVISIPFTPMDHDSESFETTASKLSESSDLALDLSFPEVQKHACEAVQKLLVMMMELDSSRRKADTQNLTTRIDGQRIAVVDLILDELSYNKDMISPFLQAFDEPELKMEIVSQFLQKYTAKSSTRHRRSTDSVDSSVPGVFKGFLNDTSTKAIVKKLGAEAIQVLLAHALQASMSISKDKLVEISGLKEDDGSNPLGHFCKNLISAFTRLKKIDAHLEILPIGKEALFTAASILSAGS
ncbi:negative regulator of systemic acquired resistance SNI1 [Silene latifolia]|uniref:negative regulator of systemic acquired resistance SNI1 n=1 Tax=Silene latifolia TaxID=37657 RepID=UPI003D78A5D1